MDGFAIFAVVAAAIALIFVSWAVFRMTKMPPGVLFIILGAILALLGSKIPVLLSDIINFSTPILFGALLFGCGFRMNILGIARYGNSFRLSLLSLFLTFTAIGGAGYFFLEMGFSEAILTAAVCASVCSFFVFHIVSTFNIDTQLADSLMLESSLTEAIALLVALAVFQIHSGASAVQAFSLGLVFGLLAGIIWVRLMKFTADFPQKDTLTLSLVLAVAAFCEMVFQGSGMTSALFFGLAMGNSNLLKSKARFDGLLKLQEDVIMAGGTFFFFYIGLSVAGIELWQIGTGVLLWLVAMLIRIASVRLIMGNYGPSVPISGLAPKGLSSVLISQAAVASGTFVFAEKLFAVMIPIVILSGIFAWVCPAMMEEKRPQRIEKVPDARGLINREKSEPIRHAYDIEEMKRSINGENEEPENQN